MFTIVNEFFYKIYTTAYVAIIVVICYNQSRFGQILEQEEIAKRLSQVVRMAERSKAPDSSGETCHDQA